MEERPPIWRVAANKLNKQSRTADEGCPGTSCIQSNVLYTEVILPKIH